MKKIYSLVMLIICAFAAVSCGSTGLIGSSSASSSSVYTAGQNVGTSLKNIYSQYKTDGKFDATNINNILNIATLATNYNTLKETEKGSQFYGDLVKGMIVGSSNLVQESTADKVKNGIVSSLSGVNLGTIINTAAQSAQNSNTAKNIESATTEVSKISNSLTNIFSLFK